MSDAVEPVALRAILRTCVEGQIAMLGALVELVDRESRGALQGRIASHRQLLDRLLDESSPYERRKAEEPR